MVRNLGGYNARKNAMRIFGVDFSGARTDTNTWLAQGILQDGVLVLESCAPVKRAGLTERLADTTGPAVAALDFPFSVPESFARHWLPEAQSMPQLWKAAAGMEYGDFLALRDSFVARHGEPKRVADTHFPECYSCLHKANPNMVPMTFRGMQMLHRLWAAGCAIPPLASPSCDAMVLLEAMPGAALRAFGLPFKGYKRGARAAQLRRQIVEKLSCRSTIPLPNLEEFSSRCLDSDDCLDSVVAAVVAALWVRDHGIFLLPAPESSPEFNPVSLLEGWLYAPVFLNHQGG